MFVSLVTIRLWRNNLVCGNHWPWNGRIITKAEAAINSYGTDQIPGLLRTVVSAFHILAPLILIAPYEIGTIFILIL